MNWRAPTSNSAYLDAPTVSTRGMLSGGMLSRGMLFAGISGVGFLNAISEKAYLAYVQNGLTLAALNTFDISAIIWVGMFVVLRDLSSARRERAISRRDWLVAACALLMILVPIPALSSCALALIGGYIALTEPAGTRGRSLGGLLLAVTIPLLWARAIFAALSDTLLAVDANLVAGVVGTQATANIVPYPDGSGAMFFGPGCSSFTNISLAILCTAIFAHIFRLKRSAEIWLWAAVSSLAVLAINVARISLIGFFPDQYDLIHGSVGSFVFGWITIASLLLIGLHGVGRVRSA